MSGPRVAPGPQLGTGRLRVDAARAIAKLREYRLAVRAAWVLEAIRAAVAARATAISLGADSNDLWLAWDGAPWPAADLPRLFDELVSPEAGAGGDGDGDRDGDGGGGDGAGVDRYAVRLLAAAVNSALGLDPAFVDVYAIGPRGTAQRARYTPDVLAEPAGELGDAPLRRIAVAPAAPPPGAGPGMAVHLRRRFGLAVLSHLVREPLELELARAACADLPVPLAVRGAPITRAPDLARVPLGEGLLGYLAVADPDVARGPAVLEVAEHGVRLATAPLELGLADGRPAPLRLFVDGPRMPTNASRSEVRGDLHPIATATRRAPQLLPAIADALAAALATGHAGAGEAARRAALALIAAARPGDAARLGLHRLLELPLLRNAVGQPRPPSARWALGPLVHTGAHALPEELAPWLGDMLWVPPGDPSGCLVDPLAVDPDAAARRVRWARRELRARRRFYDHAPRPPRVERHDGVRLRATLGAAVEGTCVDPACFDGLTGEVCILTGEPGGELVLLLDGRELERLTYRSPIPFAAVIESPRLTPQDRYRGAVRDAEHVRVEAAMRGGVIRALEALVGAPPGALPDGFTHAVPDGDGASLADRLLARHGVALALETTGRFGGPLGTARLWRLAGRDEAWTSLAALHAHAVIGVAAPGAATPAVARRPIVEAYPADEQLLARALPHVRWVRYGATAPIDAHDLARKLLGTHDTVLALHGDGWAAAIAAGVAPRVELWHAGRRLEERPYAPEGLPCAIIVDSDELVPNAAWTRALELGSIERRFPLWERELLRATAAALAGSRPDDLLGTVPIELHSDLGRTLCAALADTDPAELLGANLAARLRAAPLLRVLGGGPAISADEAAARFLGSIPFLDGETALAAPPAGFAPLVCDEVVARAMARLVGRGVHDARDDLARLRVAAERDARLAEHRRAPAIPPPLAPDAITVPLALAAIRARVGLADGERMELHYRVEDRPYADVRWTDGPPLAAVIDLPLAQTDEAFLGVPADVSAALAAEITAAAPALLGAIAAARPAELAESGPARALMAFALRAPDAPPGLREALANAPAFPTVQGPLTALTALAAAPGGAVPVAQWSGDWIAAGPGEPPDPPALRLPSGGGELAEIVRELCGATVDVTHAIHKLQAQRRMARGLLPAPAVHGIAPALRRTLADLGDAAAGLGPGEAGLVDESGSTALLHVRGVLQARLPLAADPPIHLAIEAPDLAEAIDDAPIIDSVGDLQALSRAAADAGPLATLAARAQAIAARLAEQVVAADAGAVPAWLRRRLAGAQLAGALPGLATAPIFETAAGGWVDRGALAQQVATYGDVWCVARTVVEAVPLDPGRLVLHLDPDERRRAQAAGLAVVDAAVELELDRIARTNRAQPPASSLELPPGLPALATISLDGDGVSAPRGVVAILSPEAAHQRGVRAHRAMHPFALAPDPCTWPALAIVDDARLAPDRTWTRAERDDAWQAVVAAIRAAGETAVRALVRRPDNAIAGQAITASTHAALASLRGDPHTQLRGGLWLAGPPDAAGSIRVIHAMGREPYTPPVGASLSGTIYLGAPLGPRTREALDELCADVYARLLRSLALRGGLVDPDLAAAHLAAGLARNLIAATDAPALRLACFRPALDAAGWSTLARSAQRVPLVPATAQLDELALSDDGSHTARVVLAILGPRAYLDRPAPLPARRGTFSAPPPPLGPVLAAPPPDPAAHPLQVVVAAVSARLAGLGLTPPTFAILDGAPAPLARFDRALYLAGAHPALVAIAAACHARSPFAPAAIDALTAHLVTVLNVALTSVTDATELHTLAALVAPDGHAVAQRAR